MNLFSLSAFKRYIKSVFISISATLVILGIASLIFSFFPPASWLLYALSNYSVFFAAFLCAFLTARKVSGQGLIVGMIASVLCLLVISIIGWFLFKTATFPQSFISLLPLGVLCGGIGGILGINSK